eukprot:SAG11_NODE_27392_length_333_cov_0.850427_2_plen_84_part_01
MIILSLNRNLRVTVSDLKGGRNKQNKHQQSFVTIMHAFTRRICARRRLVGHLNLRHRKRRRRPSCDVNPETGGNSTQSKFLVLQ